MSPSEHRVSLHYQENNPFSRDLIKNYSMLVEIMIYSVLIQTNKENNLKTIFLLLFGPTYSHLISTFYSSLESI